ncbi:MAG: hypothetical protein KGZ81_13870 [Flavobacteriales bacterium]|nr:hypothetical protein [Flavobacteriales bacterium]
MDKFDFEYKGLQFRCIVENDDYMRAPFLEYDGHGDIRESYNYYGRPEKNPGEVIIYSNRGCHWIYDFAGAVAKAKRENWGSKNCHPGMSKGERAATAARDDMQYCQDWLEGDRWYSRIEVFRIDNDGEKVGESEFLSGVENGYSGDCEDFLRDCAAQLAAELHAQSRKNWRKALHEARQRKYWACRDIQTIGA